MKASTRIALILITAFLALASCIPVASAKELTPGEAQVQEEIDEQRRPFRPAHWTKGFRFLPGGGLNWSSFNSDIEETRDGWGVSVRMDVGYYFTNDFAAEFSSSVNFNRINGYILWDNMFTLGIRTRLPFVSYSDKSAPYARVFAGRGPLVLVFERHKPDRYETVGAQRLQLEGPVYGAGLGIMQTTTNDSVWFMEVMMAFHSFESMEIIKSDKDVPVVIGEETLADRPTFSTIHLLIGVVIF